MELPPRFSVSSSGRLFRACGTVSADSNFMKFSQRLKAGGDRFKAAFTPSRYKAGGIQVRCSHCHGEMFRDHRTGGLVSSMALACENCGLML